MTQQITDAFLMRVAGTIEALLLEEQANIDATYKKVGDGMKISIGINLDPSAQGIVVNYDLHYDLEAKREPIEKRAIKKKETINVNQLDLLGSISTVKKYEIGQDVME